MLMRQKHWRARLLVLTVSDIHREAQMALAHANRVATMGQLTASITHEVNQPLAAPRATISMRP
jgi:C4-dicarboxylate-specific signal transduction histidine kinase